MTNGITADGITATPGIPEGGTTGQVLKKSSSTDYDVAWDTDTGATDHGALTGLADDDHTQYHNDARALTWLGTRSTADLPEGASLYYTDERVDDRVAALIQNGTGITWAYSDVANTLTPTVTITQYTDELAQDAVGGMVANTTTINLTYVDATPALTADVNDGSISNAKLADMANATIKGRTTAGTGDPEDLTAAQARTILGLALGTTDNALLRADGTGNSATQGSVATLTDAGNLTIAGTGATAVVYQGTGGTTECRQERTDTHGDNVLVGNFTLMGRDSGGASQYYAIIDGRAVLDNAGAENGNLEIRTVQASTIAQRGIFGGGLYHPSATGGDKGDNTVNYGALYDDNVLLVCAPIELLKEGSVDLAKWDNLVPKRIIQARTETLRTQEGKIEEIEIEPARAEARQHTVVRAFKAMLDEGFDPRDPRNYVERMKADGAVPGLITEAEWRDRMTRNDKPDIGTTTTRLMLAVDNLAVMCAALLDRIEALEAK